MTVIQLARYRSRETAQVLQCLADMAKRGELVGVALCYRTREQEEHLAYTGAYKANPAKAVNAAMRMSWRVLRMQDDDES